MAKTKQADSEPWLSMAEAASLLFVSVRTLQRIMARGEITYTRIGVGRNARVVFKQSYLDEWRARADEQVETVRASSKSA